MYLLYQYMPDQAAINHRDVQHKARSIELIACCVHNQSYLVETLSFAEIT